MSVRSDIEKTVKSLIARHGEPDHFSRWFSTNELGIYECGICGRKSTIQSEQCLIDKSRVLLGYEKWKSQNA